MTLFVRWLRRIYEKLVGVFYEGPKAPPRLGDAVLKFAEMNPKATRFDWIVFCQRHAASSYQSGWVRGYEWAERELDKKPEYHPDRVADALSNDWRLSEPLTLHNVDEQVTDLPAPTLNVTEALTHERQYFEDRIGKGPSR